MKVVINGYGEYEVLSISYGTDESGVPIDISVVATKEVVEELIAHDLIGNYNEDSIEDSLGNLYWETISVRWPAFQVLNARLCRCYAWNDTPMWDKITQRGI